MSIEGVSYDLDLERESLTGYYRSDRKLGKKRRKFVAQIPTDLELQHNDFCCCGSVSGHD
jgi:hypothetical protein